MSIHRPLDEELKVLRELVLEMSYLVDEQLAEGMNALVAGDVELAERVRRRDDEIDALEMKLPLPPTCG
jgi:phosphate transport system protein